jgi:hypothetical protein
MRMSVFYVCHRMEDTQHGTDTDHSETEFIVESTSQISDVFQIANGGLPGDNMTATTQHTNTQVT